MMPTFALFRRHNFGPPARLVLALVLGAAALPALAQSGTEMLLKPWDWEGGQTADLQAGTGKTTTKDSNSRREVSMSLLHLQGRVHTEGAPLMVGWQADFLRLSTLDRPAIPETMHDVGVSLATSLSPDGPVTVFTQDWDLAAEVGIGHAAMSFSDTRGYYGTATLTAGTRLSATQTLKLGVAYNGNRSFLPDVPLPGFEYEETFPAPGGDGKKPVFAYHVGIPRVGFAWRPEERWLFKVDATLTAPGSALVEYELERDRGFVFAGYTPYRLRAHQNGDDANRRLFFSNDTLEVGLRLANPRGMHLLVAVGYAMNQTLDHGFDDLDRQTRREFDAAATVRGEFRWEF